MIVNSVRMADGQTVTCLSAQGHRRALGIGAGGADECFQSTRCAVPQKHVFKLGCLKAVWSDFFVAKKWPSN